MGLKKETKEKIRNAAWAAAGNAMYLLVAAGTARTVSSGVEGMIAGVEGLAWALGQRVRPEPVLFRRGRGPFAEKFVGWYDPFTLSVRRYMGSRKPANTKPVQL